MFLKTLSAIVIVFSAGLLLTPAADARTRASGAQHSSSHGGHYSSGRGSSHKGGRYRSPSTGNQYRKHKR